jgi:hypothetical protein
VRVTQTLHNTTASTVNWSIWEISQVHCPDNQNYWAYFPAVPGSAFGDSGYVGLTGDTDDPGIFPRYREGISAVQYRGSDFKIGSDADWLCFVDEAGGYAFAKTFDTLALSTYPDQGSRIQVFSANFNPFMETEVLSPITDVPAGGSYTFVADWYLARTHGPILDMNDAGLVARRLAVNGAQVSGAYGVFHTGRVDLMFDNSAVAVATWQVTPADSLVINEVAAVPEFATLASLLLYDQSGAFVDTLDSAVLQGAGVLPAACARGVPSAVLRYHGDRLTVAAPHGGGFRLRISSAAGRVVWQQTVGPRGTACIGLDSLAPGVYTVLARDGGRVWSTRFVVMGE